MRVSRSCLLNFWRGIKRKKSGLEAGSNPRLFTLESRILTIEPTVLLQLSLVFYVINATSSKRQGSLKEPKLNPNSNPNSNATSRVLGVVGKGCPSSPREKKKTSRVLLKYNAGGTTRRVLLKYNAEGHY